MAGILQHNQDNFKTALQAIAAINHGDIFSKQKSRRIFYDISFFFE